LESKETRAQRKKTVTHNSVFAAHRRNAVPPTRDGISFFGIDRIRKARTQERCLTTD
jgi:hypothetical protein